MTELLGAHFPTLPSAVKAAKEYATQQGYEVQIDRSFKHDDAKRLICRHRNQCGCSWKLDVEKDTDTLTWKLVLVDSSHSERCQASRVSHQPPMHSSDHIVPFKPTKTHEEINQLPKVPTPLLPSTPATIQSSFASGRQQLTLTHDMRWASAKEASRAVNDFALFSQKKRARMDKKTSGGRNKKYVCSCESCGWYVRLLRAPKTENWKISSMNLQHSEHCTGIAQPTARQLADMASFRQAVVSHSKADGKLLTDDFLSSAEEGIKIPLRLAYRAKKLIAVHSQDDLVESYKFIPSLLASFERKNPHSVVNYSTDSGGHFVRAFVMPGVSQQAVLAIQKVVGVEVVPCTSQDYKGFILLLLARDGNFQPQILAFAVVPEPTTEHIYWFILFSRRGINLDRFPVVCSALYPGVVEGVRQALPSVKVRLCMRSLLERMNQEKTISKLGQAETLVWEMHHHETELGFFKTMQQLEQVNSAAATYLRSLDASLWATYMLKDQHSIRTYKWSTTTFTAGIHENTVENCDEAPFDLIYNYLTRMMDTTFRKSQLSADLIKKESPLTPGAQDLYAEEMNESLQYTTRPSDDLLAYVWKSGTRPKANFRVHLGEGTCTCMTMNQLSVPCRHFIAAARHFGHDQLIYNHFGAIYKTETFAAAFHKSRIEIPLDSDLSKDETILPAVAEGKTASGKAKKSRSITTGDSNPRKLKKPAVANVSSDTPDMDMGMITAMGMNIPGLTAQMIQQYPMPPHTFLQQMHLPIQNQQPQESSPPGPFSMV
ncbi:hypothetical protein LEN26_013691 [Aphanomyces euteiches]|nr:hypothetical protein LEN26_013691 [Aphanomyces euteiches]KAH9126896.1 hypothetical protein AeMF1_002670 [Aphanomyces euteiches]KAH9191612.1 hypothetical protein AeNC1_006404 [Aphanomyces euteiches]